MKEAKSSVWSHSITHTKIIFITVIINVIKIWRTTQFLVAVTSQDGIMDYLFYNVKISKEYFIFRGKWWNINIEEIQTWRLSKGLLVLKIKSMVPTSMIPDEDWRDDHVWQCLERFWPRQGCRLASNGWRGTAGHRTAPPHRTILPKMSVVLGLRNPVLNHSRHFQKQKDIWKCSFQLCLQMDANPFIKP